MTEEIKKKADSVVKKYRPFAKTWDCYHDVPLTDENVIKSAIQDRQSVIDKLKVTGYAHRFGIQEMISELNQQIEYLNSKLQHND